MRVAFVLFRSFWVVFGGLLLAGPPRARAQPAGQHITAVTVETPEPVGCYEKFEVGLTLDRAFTTGELDGNPYEPADVSVEARFTGPEGKARAVRYGFYYADFAIHPDYLAANDARYWEARPTPQPWRVRFAPDAPGRWQYTLTVRYRDGTTETLPARTFTCGPSANPGFLRVAPNRRNLIFDSGKSFLAIGSNADYWSNTSIGVPPYLAPLPPGTPNLGYCGPGGTVATLTLPAAQQRRFSTYSYPAFDQVFRELAANGGNFARVWLQKFSWDMEQYDPAADLNTMGNYAPYQHRLYDLDRVLESAHQHGIYLHLTLLDGVQMWQVGDQPGWATFAYRQALGLAQPVDFFTDPQARHFFKNRLRYIVSRWGYGPAAASFELINEGDIMDAGQAFLQHFGPAGPDFVPLRTWTVEMARYLKVLAPNHLQTLSYIPDNADEFLRDYPNLFDYSVSHDYSTSFQAQVQRSFRAQLMTRRYQRPYQLQEYDYTPYVEADYAVKFHVTPWATAFNGSFGTALHLSAFANLHHPCWPAYTYYQPLARFLAATGFSSAAPNLPVGNAAGTATALYGRFRAAMRASDPLLTTIPATADPAYSSPCDRSCPAPYFGSVGLAPSTFHSDQPRYLASGLSTTNDGLIEAFALQNPAQVTGWVHNKTHYWYNLPHDNKGFCDSCAVNPGLRTRPNTITPLRGQRLTISHLKRRATYTVRWFYAYPGQDVDGNGNPDDGGFLPGLDVTQAAVGGRLTVAIPPLVALGSDGPGTAPDYGFVVVEQPAK